MNIPNSPFQVHQIEPIEGTYIDNHPLCSEVKSMCAVTTQHPIIRYIAYTFDDIDAIVVAAYYITTANQLNLVHKCIKGVNNFELKTAINELYKNVFIAPYTMVIPDAASVHLFIYEYFSRFIWFKHILCKGDQYN